MDFYSKLNEGKKALDYTKDQDNNLTRCNVAAKFKVEILVFSPNRICLVSWELKLWGASYPWKINRRDKTYTKKKRFYFTKTLG